MHRLLGIDGITRVVLRRTSIQSDAALVFLSVKSEESGALRGARTLAGGKPVQAICYLTGNCTCFYSTDYKDYVVRLTLFNPTLFTGFMGNVKVKVLPLPNSLITHILPPCNSTRRFVSVRPRPVPS